MIRMGKKWSVLLAALCMQTILGGVYAWSTLSVWIREEMGISNAQAGLVFGLTIMVFTAVMVYSGRLLPRLGPKKTASIGALAYGLGFLVASYSQTSFLVLLLGISLLSGIGIGFAYVVPLSVCLKWFPNQKGLVTGLSVGGFGGGAIILSAIIEQAYLSLSRSLHFSPGTASSPQFCCSCVHNCSQSRANLLPIKRSHRVRSIAIQS